MQISASTALWFLPFALPICMYVAWSDLKAMRIPNYSVVALTAVFAVIGLVALPFDAYLWRYVHLIVALFAGILLNAGGAMGAGDAKFIAAAAPFVAIGDLLHVTAIFSGCLLAGWITHRIAKYSPIRKMTPDWESWEKTKDFPMGFPLGATLVAYLAIGAFG